MLIFIVLITFLILIWAYLFHDKYKPSKHHIPEDSFYKGKARITLHFYSSPMGINWSSPRSLFYSSFINQILPMNRAISHVAIEVQSSQSAQLHYYNFTSMTDTDKDVFQKLFKEKLGLGMLVTTYPGALENSGALQKELKRKRRYGRVHSLTYLVNDTIIDRVKKYLEEYIECGNNKVYAGLDKDPRYKEGAGCLAFCRSVIEIAGLDKEEFHQRWNQVIKIPHRLIGQFQENGVSLFKIILSSKSMSWASEDEAYTPIKFWDLDSIFKSLENLGVFLDCKQPNIIINEKFIEKMEYRKIIGSYEFLFDRSEITPPNDPFWLER